MITIARVKSSLKAGFIHLCVSAIITLLTAVLVFYFWYPYPFRYFSGGSDLFLLLVCVDIVCGPILTLIIFNKLKSPLELAVDIGIIGFIQCVALGYGVYAVAQARPLFLVMEIDRFKVVTAVDLQEPVANAELKKLPLWLVPKILSGPKIVAIRNPVDEAERLKVMVESVQGGRDYSLRPEFYTEYNEDFALKAMVRAKPIGNFLEKYPGQRLKATAISEKSSLSLDVMKYIPVVARQDWIAVLDQKGQIQGFLKGDGF